MKSENIESTICGGKWLMREKKFPHLDAEKILATAAKQAEAVRKRAKIKLPKRFNWT
jgi:5-methylthioadenosine/S-adenosylhomocysteine deaminase